MAARKRKSTRKARKISIWRKFVAWLILAVFVPIPQAIGVSEVAYSELFPKAEQTVLIPARIEPRVFAKVAVSYKTPVVKEPEVEQKVEAKDFGNVWDQLAQCESGGNWSINTGNGYYGGVQFSLTTWKAMGGNGLPSEATKEEQIAIATALQSRSGWGQWPACSRRLGLI